MCIKSFSQAFEVEVIITFLLTTQDSCSKFSNHIQLEKIDKIIYLNLEMAIIVSTFLLVYLDVSLSAFSNVEFHGF